MCLYYALKALMIFLTLFALIRRSLSDSKIFCSYSIISSSYCVYLYATGCFSFSISWIFYDMFFGCVFNSQKLSFSGNKLQSNSENSSFFSSISLLISQAYLSTYVNSGTTTFFIFRGSNTCLHVLKPLSNGEHKIKSIYILSASSSSLKLKHFILINAYLNDAFFAEV